MQDSDAHQIATKHWITNFFIFFALLISLFFGIGGFALLISVFFGRVEKELPLEKFKYETTINHQHLFVEVIYFLSVAFLGIFYR